MFRMRTPGISDRLPSSMPSPEIRVVPVPGASALIGAERLGLPMDSFVFLARQSRPAATSLASLRQSKERSSF